MRAFRLSYLIPIITTIFVLVVAESRYPRSAFGQASSAAPATPVPLTPPPPPGQPQPLSTIGTIPQLLPAPGSTNVVAASPAATPRVFVCTCSGPGFPTSWSGHVASSSYILARQSAVTSCTTFLNTKYAQSTYIPPASTIASTLGAPVTTVSGGLYSYPPGQIVSPLTTTFPNQNNGVITRELNSQRCENCACN